MIAISALATTRPRFTKWPRARQGQPTFAGWTACGFRHLRFQNLLQGRPNHGADRCIVAGQQRFTLMTSDLSFFWSWRAFSDQDR
jgi:hypothetical protein